MGRPDLCRLRTEQIREKMLLRLWKTGDLAKRSGLERQTVNRALAGHPITRHTAARIAKALSQEPEIPGLEKELASLDLDIVEEPGSVLEEAG